MCWTGSLRLYHFPAVRWIIIKKLLKYGAAGVREYWIVDSMKQLILVYNFEYDTFEQDSFSDKVKAGIYEDFEIDFSEINFE